MESAEIRRSPMVVGTYVGWAGSSPGSWAITLHDVNGTPMFGGGALDAILAFLDESEAGSSRRELVTLLFTDVVGSTRSVAEVGDEAWRRVFESLDDVVANRARRFRRTVVKQTGDVGGLTVHIAASVSALAEGGQALVSRTVAESPTCWAPGCGWRTAGRTSCRARPVAGRCSSPRPEPGRGHGVPRAGPLRVRRAW